MSRLGELLSRLPEEIDCALITSDINRRYFSGMRSSAGIIAAFREETYLIIDGRYYEKACGTVRGLTVIREKSRLSQLNELLERHCARMIAIEAETVTVSELSTYRQQLKADIDDSGRLSDTINEMRMCKTSEELDRIRAAQRIAEAAFEHILGFIKAGVTEREIALELDFFMLRNGAEALSFDTIALTGKNTSLPHGVPSDTAVKTGDFVLMDYGAVVDGYHSDMTRTVCVGAPDDEMCEVYETVLSAQQAAIDTARAGVSCRDMDAAARRVIESSGYGEFFVHSLGHGVGLEIHEFPNAAPRSNAVLRNGMVITAEPGIYIPDKFGVRIEDFLAICDENPENLTKSPKNLIIL